MVELVHFVDKDFVPLLSTEIVFRDFGGNFLGQLSALVTRLGNFTLAVFDSSQNLFVLINSSLRSLCIFLCSRELLEFD